MEGVISLWPTTPRTPRHSMTGTCRPLLSDRMSLCPWICALCFGAGPEPAPKEASFRTGGTGWSTDRSLFSDLGICDPINRGANADKTAILHLCGCAMAGWAQSKPIGPCRSSEIDCFGTTQKWLNICPEETKFEHLACILLSRLLPAAWPQNAIRTTVWAENSWEHWVLQAEMKVGQKFQTPTAPSMGRTAPTLWPVEGGGGDIGKHWTPEPLQHPVLCFHSLVAPSASQFRFAAHPPQQRRFPLSLPLKLTHRHVPDGRRNANSPLLLDYLATTGAWQASSGFPTPTLPIC